MKLCKDCKYCKKHWLWGGRHAECNGPHIPYTTNYATGKSFKETKYCEIERKYDHLCGPDARHFEAKQ
jgi:hypothetical protein